MPITNLVKVGVCVDCIALATVTFCVFCFGSLLYLPSLFFYSFLGDPKTVWFLSLSFFLSFVLEVSFIFHLCFFTVFLEILKQFDSYLILIFLFVFCLFVFCFGSLLYLPSLFFYSFLGDPKTVWFLSLSFFLSFVLEVSFIFHLCFSTVFVEIL